MTDIYSKYETYVKTLVDSGDLSTFKQNSNYTYMLEHVSYQQGKEYLKLIKDNTQLTYESISEFCSLNDSIGNTKTYEYDLLVCSPTSLRYIYQAYLIITHFKTFNQSINIVEVGGGYGGLFLAIDFFAKKYQLEIESYTIIDLPVIIKFQQLYLSKFNSSIPINFIESTTYGAELSSTNLCLISNYCFSEIPIEMQKEYIKILFPKIIHGFITWNMIPLYNFGFKMVYESENPKTGPLNFYVRF